MVFLPKKFRLTCEDTSQLISQMMDRKLPPVKRLRVKIHLAMCKFCEYYKKQLEIIHQLAVGLAREDPPARDETSLPVKTREKIQQMINSNK